MTCIWRSRFRVPPHVKVVNPTEAAGIWGTLRKASMRYPGWQHRCSTWSPNRVRLLPCNPLQPAGSSAPIVRLQRVLSCSVAVKSVCVGGTDDLAAMPS